MDEMRKHTRERGKTHKYIDMQEWYAHPILERRQLN